MTACKLQCHLCARDISRKQVKQGMLLLQKLQQVAVVCLICILQCSDEGAAHLDHMSKRRSFLHLPRLHSSGFEQGFEEPWATWPRCSSSIAILSDSTQENICRPCEGAADGQWASFRGLALSLLVVATYPSCTVCQEASFAAVTSIASHGLPCGKLQTSWEEDDGAVTG